MLPLITEQSPLTSRNVVTSESSSGMTGRSTARKRKTALQPKQIEDEDDFQIIAVGEHEPPRVIVTGSSTGLCDDSGIDYIELSSSSPISPPEKRVALGQVSNTDPTLLRRGSGFPFGGQRNQKSYRNSKMQFSNQTELLSSPTASGKNAFIIRPSPLPCFDWADTTEVWEHMVKKDESYKRNPCLMERHPSLQPRMRSILLDWLSEVSEVYKLHRDTFYLSIDYIDRFLSNESDIPKQELQLIGITCLFIAAKMEEIYPPKLNDFAYVTDGACSEVDIVEKEILIHKSLEWKLTPLTANGWLSVYVQLYSILSDKENASPTMKSTKNIHSFSSRQASGGVTHDSGIAGSSPTSSRDSSTSTSSNRDFMIPGYSSQFFAQVAHLLDLSILDIGSLQFPYSIMAASALYHFTNENVVFQCTGLKLPEIRDCVLWMTPFALAIRDQGFEDPKLFKSSDLSESMHAIQQHTADLALLEKAQEKQRETLLGSVAMTPVSTTTILTPPKSVSKGMSSSSSHDDK